MKHRIKERLAERKIVIWISERDHARLKEICREAARSISSYVRELIAMSVRKGR